MVGGGDAYYLKFWVNHPRWREIADFEPIFARSASAVTPSEKSSVNTNRKSTTRFPMSPRWTSYIVSKPPKGAQKLKMANFCLKSHSAWRKYATVSLCENCLWQSCRSFIDLTICVKVIGGRRPLKRKFCISNLLLDTAVVLSRIVTNALFASQFLQWNLKLTELTDVFGCITWLRMKTDKIGIAR